MGNAGRERQGSAGDRGALHEDADRFCLPGLRLKPGIQPHVAGAGHPAYGRPLEAVAERLTCDNWRHKFLVCQHPDGPVVVYLQEVTLLDAEEQRIAALEVVVAGPARTGRLGAYFLDPVEALVYANGEDAEPLATRNSAGTAADLLGPGAVEPGSTIGLPVSKRSGKGL